MSFTFKQFHIDDSRCAMKVGTDGVLLGAWADVSQARRILDIGCGSGLLSLMAAQRQPAAHITAIELDAAAVLDAQENIRRSPFSHRISVVQANVVEWAVNPVQQRKFDCIISNPPYYEEDLLPPSQLRAQARHTAGGGLTFAALLRSVKLLLHDGQEQNARETSPSTFSVILPSQAQSHFCTLAALHGLILTRRTDIVTRPHKPCKRVLLEFSLSARPLVHSVLSLLGDGNSRSAEYQALCADFYL